MDTGHVMRERHWSNNYQHLSINWKAKERERSIFIRASKDVAKMLPNTVLTITEELDELNRLLLLASPGVQEVPILPSPSHLIHPAAQSPELGVITPLLNHPKPLST